MQKSVQNLVLSIAVPVVGGYLSALPTKDAVATWYQEIRKPSWTPPRLAFPIVWTSLYSAMGYASYRILTQMPQAFPAITLTQVLVAHPSSAMYWFAIQLGLNYAWTPLFFGQRAFLAASIEGAVMVGAIAQTILAFGKIDSLASKLLIPYILWVSGATYLSSWIYRNNRDVKFVQNAKGEWHTSTNNKSKKK